MYIHVLQSKKDSKAPPSSHLKDTVTDTGSIMTDSKGMTFSGHGPVASNHIFGKAKEFGADEQ